jgi:hypothetical protein
MEKRLKNIQTFEQHLSELNISDVSDSFIIERKKNNRLFFITKDCELTWRKENAWKFNSEEDVRNEIKNNRLLELIAGDYYKIVKYSEARSH